MDWGFGLGFVVLVWGFGLGFRVRVLIRGEGVGLQGLGFWNRVAVFVRACGNNNKRSNLMGFLLINYCFIINYYYYIIINYYYYIIIINYYYYEYYY